MLLSSRFPQAAAAESLLQHRRDVPGFLYRYQSKRAGTVAVMSSFINFNSSTSSAREGTTQPEARGRPASAWAPAVASVLGAGGLTSGTAGAQLHKLLFCTVNTEFGTTAVPAGAAATVVVASLCRKEVQTKLGRKKP